MIVLDVHIALSGSLYELSFQVSLNRNSAGWCCNLLRLLIVRRYSPSWKFILPS